MDFLNTKLFEGTEFVKIKQKDKTSTSLKLKDIIVLE